MPGKFSYLRKRLESSIWFLPLCFCVASFALGVAMLQVDRALPNLVAGLGPLAMPVDSARQVLSVIAGSVITVGGVSFSITMVALTLTSGQYGPRVLRHFLEDNASKVSLALFLAAYVYALVVLTGFQETDRPHLTVIVALLLVLAALVGFIHFIHRIATDLQADQVIERIGVRLRSSLADLVELADEKGRSHDVAAWRRRARPGDRHSVPSTANGYVQTIDYPGLVGWCADHDARMLVRVRAGDFVITGEAVLTVYGPGRDTVEDATAELNTFLVTGPVRTAVQDPEFPIAQLDQVATRALSPGINDPGTAISCIDAYTVALAKIVDAEMPGNVLHDTDDEPRLLIRASRFDGLVKRVFSRMRQHVGHEISVRVSLLEALCRLASMTERRDRLALLGEHGRLIREAVDDDRLEPYDLDDIHQRFRRLEHLVASRSGA
ncbi:MAG: DUF2254 domain-containing protein [Gammaproteobacteria bacterium]|nr:DUF2254 domain-containing protein [Gammaproteobacteria bacterium]